MCTRMAKCSLSRPFYRLAGSNQSNTPKSLESFNNDSNMRHAEKNIVKADKFSVAFIKSIVGLHHILKQLSSVETTTKILMFQQYRLQIVKIQCIDVKMFFQLNFL